MNTLGTAPHSYYPSDVWAMAEASAERDRDDVWVASDPDMQALAALGESMKAEGEEFGTYWAALN